jgi:predicted flap endonuclease-1-like 5' DNA nuclease
LAARPGRAVSQYPVGEVKTSAEVAAALDETLQAPGGSGSGAVPAQGLPGDGAARTAGTTAAEPPAPPPQRREVRALVDPDVATVPTGAEAPADGADDGEDLSREAAVWGAWRQQAPAAVQLVEQIAALPPAKRAAADAALAVQTLPRFVDRLQDLADVHGIGQTYERRLYRAGIGTFWEVAHIDDSGFDGMLAPNDLQRAVMDYAALRADARRLAEATESVGWLWQGEPPDDFEPIHGIGKVFEQRLYDAGIYTYRSLAAAAPEEIAAICGSRMPVPPDYASWIAQAQILLQGK